jgi:sugar lactone lactonase YvrE
MKTWQYNTPGVSIIFLLFVILFPVQIIAQEDIIDFESDRWVLKDAQILQYMDRKCLSGYAYLKDLEFENGIIEVDIAVDGTRSYPGIVFRMQSEQDYERFYIRPHRSNLYPDVLQYTPAFNGVDSWQLYNGEGFTAGASIPVNQWIHLKIEISGKQARIYLDNEEKPALVITDLKHGITRGTIGVFGPKNKTAYFSNFSYRADHSLKFDPPPETKTPLGIITEWELSPAFDISQIDLELTPSQQGLGNFTWQKIKSEPSGLVDISRFVKKAGGAVDCVFARTTLNSDKDEVMNLKFGYSDAVSIFSNGDMIFFGNSAYRQRDPSFLGIVGLNDAVYLPLKKGENELILMIAESFGGWGFVCQDGNAIFQHENLTKLWELSHKLKYPESVVHDGKRNVLYVSNYFYPQRGFISKVNLDGEIEDLEWVTNLNRPTGMYIFEDKLFVVDRTSLIEIDIQSGQIVTKNQVPKARFINDVAFDPSGNAYITDTQADVIYRFKSGEFEIWLENQEIKNPNGLCVDKDMLLVGNSGDGCLKSVNLADKKINTIAYLGKGSVIDGIKADAGGNYIVSDYNGRVFLISPSGDKTELLDTTTPQLFCADLEYIIDKSLLVIPTLFDNRIMTYKWNE